MRSTVIMESWSHDNRHNLLGKCEEKERSTCPGTKQMLTSQQLPIGQVRWISETTQLTYHARLYFILLLKFWSYTNNLIYPTVLPARLRLQINPCLLRMTLYITTSKTLLNFIVCYKKINWITSRTSTLKVSPSGHTWLDVRHVAAHSTEMDRANGEPGQPSDQ